MLGMVSPGACPAVPWHPAQAAARRAPPAAESSAAAGNASGRKMARTAPLRRFLGMLGPPPVALAFLCGLAPAAPQAGAPDATAGYTIVGDGIPAPLEGRAGNAGRGRAIVAGREGNCLACHHAPVPEEPFHGDLGPDLRGVGGRYDAAQLRLRLVAPRAVNPETVMPAFHQVEGLRRVARPYRGLPILDAQGIEDVIAYLLTLREAE